MAGQIPTFRLYGEKSGTSADFWILCETLPSRSRLHNWEIAAHRHKAFFQIFTLTAGQGVLFTRTGRLELAAPCIIFIPPGAVHGFNFSHDVDGLVLTALADRLHGLAASDPGLDAFARQIRVQPLAPPGHDDAGFAALCIERIAAELSRSAAARMVMVDHLLPAALVCLARASGTAHQGDLRDRDRQRMLALEALIGAHFTQRRGIEFYAGRIGVSRTHLNRLARQATGRSVQAMIATRIVEAAKRELIFSLSPVQSIAYALGFSDPAYFNRFFRRRAGTTPGAFRSRERARLAASGGLGDHADGDATTRTGEPSSQA